MKNSIRFLCLCVSVVMLFALTGCTDKGTDKYDFKSKTVYDGGNVFVQAVQRLDEGNYGTAERKYPGEEAILGTNGIVVAGEILQQQEIKIDCTYEGRELTPSYLTLVKFEVSEYLYHNSKLLPKKEILTIGMGTSSYAQFMGSPVPDVGKEFILICMVPDEHPYQDPRDLGKYMDCYNSVYCMAIEKANDMYIVNQWLAPYFTEFKTLKGSEHPRSANKIFEERGYVMNISPDDMFMAYESDTLTAIREAFAAYNEGGS